MNLRLTRENCKISFNQQTINLIKYVPRRSNYVQHQVESLQRQVTKYPGDIAKLENELESANRRVTKLEEELDTAKEEIEARIQHEAKITREFRTSAEEKGKLENEIKTLQKENEDLKGEITKLLKSVSNQLLTTNHRFEELDVEKAEAHRQVKLLSNELESANRRVTKLEEELDAAKEEIETRIQHEAKITREFRTSAEEKGKLEKEIEILQDQCQALQVQLEVNRVDFEQERSDRASAAGRYAEQEEELRKIIEQTGEELGRKTEEATEIGLERDRLKRELIQLKEVSVANKREGPLSIPAEESALLPLVSLPFVSGQYAHKECRPYSQENEWAISETMDSEKKENPSTSSMSHQGQSLNLAMDTVVHNSPQLRQQSQCSVGDIPRPLPCVRGFEEKHSSTFPDHSGYTQHRIHILQVSDSSSESILPSPHVPVQDSTYDEMEPHRCPRNLREGLTAEIHKEAEKLKRNPQDEVYDVPDDTNESIWPFDPNLECPHCGKRFRRGQIREYRYHLDDEHAQSM